MIRIARPPDEPARLAAEREQGLARVRALRVEDPERRLTADDLRGYKVVARDLWQAQGKKCGYCEAPIEKPHSDTEHYRPKKTYWWLAWSWENLLFSCPMCNRKCKRDRFPLRHGSIPLQPEQSPPGEEDPLLLDPASPADPLDSIEFRQQTIERRTRWIPVGKDDRGEETIKTLGLTRDGLLDRYDEHVKGLRDRAQPLLAALKARDERAIQRKWQRLLRSFLRASSPFAALAHDVIATLVPEHVRQRWRLTLERPPIAIPRRQAE